MEYNKANGFEMQDLFEFFSILLSLYPKISIPLRPHSKTAVRLCAVINQKRRLLSARRKQKTPKAFASEVKGDILFAMFAAVFLEHIFVVFDSVFIVIILYCRLYGFFRQH